MTSTDLPLSRAKVADTAMELHCCLVQIVLRYLRSRYGDDLMRRIVRDTDMSLEYLEGSSHWISYEYYCRFLAKAVEFTGNPRLAFDAGISSFAVESFGVIGKFIRHLGSPPTAYRLAVQFNSLWSRVNKWQLVKMSRNGCVISVTFPHVKQDRNNCLAIQGSLAAGMLLFSLPCARVEELKCACNEGNSCIYQVHWVSRPTRLWGYAGLVAGLGVGTGSWLAGWDFGAIGCAVLMGMGGYLAGRRADYSIRLKDVYAKTEEQASSLLESIRATEKLNEDLQKKVEQRTAELSDANQQLERTIRELKESQEKVIMAERQAAVGVLAAGMAHEINNPMNAIRLSLQALRESLPGGCDMSGVVETATRATTRCSRIVSDLLSFAREPQQVAQVALRDILAETLADFRKEHPGEFQIVTQFSESVVPLRLDRAQIKQALTNILVNAYDAMEGRGLVEVSLDSNNREVVLAIKDRGPGIEESLLRKVFDPFFTTKKSATRKGTGLGLSIAYQLVHRNGGEVEVKSEKGQGATFSFHFPLHGGAGRPGNGSGNS